MPDSGALKAMREHLRHWQKECEAAKGMGDAERIARCECFIRQCEFVIAALEDKAKRRK